MSDQFSVTATFDKTSYNSGDKMTVSISGGDVQTANQTETVTVVLTITAADGATGTVSVSVPVTKAVATPESVVITSVTDSDGRTWAVAAGGLSASATA